MTLNEKTINAYRLMLNSPEEYKLPFKSINDIFEQSDDVIAKHTVYEKYQKVIDKEIPKLIFYIIMDEIFKQNTDEHGDLGYMLKFTI